MLKRFLAGFLLLTVIVSHAQILKPAKLFAETPTKTIRVGDVVDLVFKVTIDEGWYVYTVDFDAECGPYPMAITLEKDPSFELVGNLVAINDKAKHDKIFNCDVRI